MAGQAGGVKSARNDLISLLAVSRFCDQDVLGLLFLLVFHLEHVWPIRCPRVLFYPFLISFSFVLLHRVSQLSIL